MATAPFKVKALYEYTSNHEDDLPFDVGQVITVTDEDDPDWYGGEYVDAAGEKFEGIFPRNFVEKYEPTAPPRPTRSRKKEPEPEPEPEAEPEPPMPVPEPVAPEEPEELEEDTPVPSAPLPPPPAAGPLSPKKAPTAPVPKPADPAPAPIASPAPAPPKAEPAAQTPAKAPAPARGGPPPVSEKPTSSSFKDRIAAFNKAAAPPIAPFKPSGLSSGGSSGFIKKPFVAPPPSRNAYVPPPREAPAAKIYRRDEDPEIREREAENEDSAAKAGLLPTGSPQDANEEDQPKPMSLKERMAMLQKQQAENAQRHSEAASKKEKPKRPPKKRTDSEEPQERPSGELSEAPSLPSLDRNDTESVDETVPQHPPRQPMPIRRKSTKGPPEDGNEADMSGAGDTTEGPEDVTERDDSDAQPKRIERTYTGASSRHEKPEPAVGGEEEAAEDEEGGEGEEEDEDEDPEVRRKEELRARMAKMSAGMGGMGMMGMHNPFAAPMVPGAGKKKKPPPPERRASQPEEDVPTARMAAPPIPTMMALPGMGQKKEAVEPEEPESPVEDEPTPITTTSPRGAVPERTCRVGR
jgi:myosin tail region-interacting protein MTI1